MDFGLLASCTLGGMGKGNITREGYRRVREAVQLTGSRRSEQGCEVPHDGPLFAEADKQVDNARFVRHSCSALTACTCLRAPGKKPP